MKKIIILFILVIMLSFAFADRQISGEITCNSLYVGGATNTLELTLTLASPDTERLAYLQLTFADGVTPAVIQADIGTFFFNNTTGQTVTWGAGQGDTSMGYLSASSSPFEFTCDVDIAAETSGSIVVDVYGAGDDYDAEPHTFSNTFNIDPALDYDLVAVGISGNITPSVDLSTTFAIEVFNQGQNAATNFDVTLYEGSDNMIGTVNIANLDPGTTENYDFTWTPVFPGNTQLRGVVNYDADMNIDNNQTQYFNIYVQDDVFGAISIGENTGNLQNYIPANFYWKNSLTQTWYYPDEFAYFPPIGEIVYFCNFVTDFSSGTPLKVWIGETTQPNAEAGWIPSDQLTLVFDGDVLIPSGSNEVIIPLDIPFIYTGYGNLVIYVNRPMDTDYHSSSDKWECSINDSHPNRTRYMYSDSDEFDPANPDAATANVYVSNEYANILFYSSLYVHGMIEGYVYEDNGRDIITEAEIIVTNGVFSLTKATNSTGSYFFDYLPPGDYTMEVSANGYYPTSDNFTISTDDHLIHDIYLDPLTTINVSGHVITSDTEIPAIGAEVYLEGIDNYETVTDTEGMFTILGVTPEQTYTLIIDYDSYQTYEEIVLVDTNDLNLGDVIVEEIALPVTNVVAEINQEDNVVITWNAPNGAATEFRWDDGVNLGRFSTQEAETTNTRLLETYNLHRLVEGDQDDPDRWVEIATGITDTTYVDETWSTVDPGEYRYAVTAVYTNGVEADPAFSSPPQYPPVLPITFIVSTNSGEDPEGAIVTLTNIDGNPEHVYQAIAPTGGYVNIPQVLIGFYDLNVSLDGFETFVQTDVIIFEVMTIDVVLEEAIQGIKNLTGINNYPGEVYLSWTPTYAGNILLVDDDGSADLDFTDTTPYYTAIFDEMGIEYTVYEIPVSGDDGPDATTMENYDIVVWETGEQWTDGNTINSNDENNLATYVDGGGKIIISSPDYLFDAYTSVGIFSAGQFPYDYLGVGNAIQDAIQLLQDSMICYGRGYAEGIYVRINNIFIPRNRYGIYLDFFTPNNLGTNYCSINNYSVGVQTENSVFTTADLAALVDGIDTVIEWMTSTINNLLATRDRTFLGYNITRDGSEIATGVMDMEYTDTGLFTGTYEYTVTGVYSSGNSNTLAATVEVTQGNGVEDLIPVVTELKGNYPNPFNPSNAGRGPTTKISFSVVEPGNVTIDIYNLKGEKVKTLVDGYMNADFYNVEWNGTDDNNTTVASGVYFYKMNAGRYTSTKKMILMK